MSARLKISLLVVLVVLLLTLIPLPFCVQPPNLVGWVWRKHIMQFGIVYYVGVLGWAWALAMFIPPLRRSMLAPGKWVRCITVGSSLCWVALGGWVMVSLATRTSTVDFFGGRVFPGSPYVILGISAALVAGSVAALCASACITRKGLGYGVLWVLFALKLPELLEYLWFYVAKLPELGMAGILPLVVLGGLLYAAYRLFTATCHIPLVKDGEPGATLTLRYVPAGFWSFCVTMGIAHSVALVGLTFLNHSQSIEAMAEYHDWFYLGLYALAFVGVQYRMARVMFPMERLQAQLAEQGLGLQGGDSDLATALNPRLHLMAWYGALILVGLTALPYLVEYACTSAASPLYRPDTEVAFSGFGYLGNSVFEFGAWISGLILLHRMDAPHTTADTSPTPSYFIGK